MSVAMESFRRVRHKGLADRFYARFLNADPEIARLFSQTDLQRQKDLLLHGIHMLLEYADGRLLGTLAMRRMAEMHHHIGVKVAMYDVWLDCLVVAVAELDPNYSDDVGRAWRASMEQGIAYMIECQGRVST